MRNPVAAIPVRAGRVGALQVAAERFGPGPLNPWQENYYVAEDGRVVTQYTSSRAADVWLPDYDTPPVLRAIPGGVPAASGLRTVENKISNPESFASWAAFEPSATTFTDNGDGTASVVRDGTGTSTLVAVVGLESFSAAAAGDDRVVTLEIKQGSPGQPVITLDSNGGTQTLGTLTPTDSWQRVRAKTFNWSGSSLQIRIAAPTAGDTVDIIIRRQAHYDVTGASNQNPSEYTDTFAYYATELANTVDGSGIVTEAVGAEITGWQWEHVPAATNVFLNSTAPVTQTITLGTGDWTTSVVGSGTYTTSAGTATATGYGAATDGSDNTINVTGAGTVIFTETVATPDYVQVENTAFSTPPIVTTGSSASRDIEDVRKTLTVGTNFNQREGTLVVEGWVPALSAADYPNGLAFNIAAVDSRVASIMYIQRLSSQMFLRTFDGTAAQATRFEFAADNEYDLATHYGNGTQQTGYRDVTGGGNWVWGAAAAYDGEFVLGDWVIGYVNAFPFTYENIEYFHTDLGTDKVEQLYP